MPGTAPLLDRPQPGPFTSSIALLSLAGLYLYRNLLAATSRFDQTFSDFGNYLRAAKAILAGSSPFTIHNFDYPPLLAIVVLPIAPLTSSAARLAWFLLGHLCLLAAALLLWRRLGGDRLAGLVVAAVWTLAGTVAENLVLGQVNPLLLLLLTLALVLPPCRASSSIAAAAALKLWPATLLLGDLLAARWRPLAIGIVVAVLLVAGPLAGLALLLPPPHLPTSSGYWAGTPATLSFSLPSTALRLATMPQATATSLPFTWIHGNNPEELHLPPGLQLLALATAALTMAGGLLLLWLRTRNEPPDRLVVNGALVALTLAAAPICWYHYHLLQLPAVAALALGAACQRRWWLLLWLALLTVGLTWPAVLSPSHLGIVSVHGQALFHLVRGLLVPLLSLMLATLLVCQQPGSRTRATDAAHQPPA